MRLCLLSLSLATSANLCSLLLGVFPDQNFHFVNEGGKVGIIGTRRGELIKAIILEPSHQMCLVRMAPYVITDQLKAVYVTLQSRILASD